MSTMTKTFLIFQMNFYIETYLNKLLSDERYDWDQMVLHYHSTRWCGGPALLH